MSNLSGKTALVTGAGTGIGRGVAQRLAEDGADVIIIGRTEATLREAAGQHERISYLVADLGRSEDLEHVIGSIESGYGKLYILVNNAGTAPVTPFTDLEMAEFDRVFQSNVRGLVELSGRPVATLQKVQPRVQISPIIIMVAWPWFQHSPKFGQPASSQTVVRPWSRTTSTVSLKRGPERAFTRIQCGRGGRGVSGRFAFSGCRSAAIFRSRGMASLSQACSRRRLFSQSARAEATVSR